MRSPSSLAIAAGDPGSWPGRIQAGEVEAGVATGRSEHDDLGAGFWDADDRVEDSPFIDIRGPVACRPSRRTNVGMGEEEGRLIREHDQIDVPVRGAGSAGP